MCEALEGRVCVCVIERSWERSVCVCVWGGVRMCVTLRAAPCGAAPEQWGTRSPGHYCSAAPSLTPARRSRVCVGGAGPGRPPRRSPGVRVCGVCAVGGGSRTSLARSLSLPPSLARPVARTPPAPRCPCGPRARRPDGDAEAQAAQGGPWRSSSRTLRAVRAGHRARRPAARSSSSYSCRSSSSRRRRSGSRRAAASWPRGRGSVPPRGEGRRRRRGGGTARPEADAAPQGGEGMGGAGETRLPARRRGVVCGGGGAHGPGRWGGGGAARGGGGGAWCSNMAARLVGGGGGRGTSRRFGGSYRPPPTGSRQQATLYGPPRTRAARWQSCPSRRSIESGQ